MRKWLLIPLLSLVALFLSSSVIADNVLIDTQKWYGRPSLLDVNGTWILVYREASGHGLEPDAKLNIRFSVDKGQTWTLDNTRVDGQAVVGFPIRKRDSTDVISDGHLLKAPDGTLLLLVWTSDTRYIRRGERLFKSADNGKMWIAAADNIYGQLWRGSSDSLVVGNTIYVTVFNDPDDNIVPPFSTSLWKSPDSGTTWSFVSDIASNTNEADVVYLGGDVMLAVLRSDSELTTYQRYSLDMGQTWQPLQDITSQVGILQRAVLEWKNGLVHLWGRQATPTGEYPVHYYSTDKGINWQRGEEIDDTLYVDAGYIAVLWLNETDYYLVTYQGNDVNADLVSFKRSLYAIPDAVPVQDDQFIWRNDSYRVLDDQNRTATANWTLLDLTSVTSPDAQIAILLLTVHIDSYTIGIVKLEVRKAGTQPFNSPGVLGMLGQPNDDFNVAQVLVGMDAGQQIEYRLRITGTAQADFYIDVAGYQ